MDFRQFIIWDGMLHFASLAMLLLLGNTLRRKIPFLRRSLLPTAVIAGLIGLILKETLLEALAGSETVEGVNRFFEMVTYHTIALGFIALGLKVHESYKFSTKQKQSLFSGLIIVSTYLLQGIVGLSVSLLLAFTLFPDLFSAAGMLMPMGFGQGPGQALNIGIVYEISHGFAGGSTFGLAIASFGFFWGAIVGVVYLNRQHKKGRIERANVQRSRRISMQEIESPDEIPLAESIDKFTIQVALVLFVYAVTYGFMSGVDSLITHGLFGEFGLNTVRPLIWGFNFIFGTLIAILFKKIFLIFRKTGIMTRQYPNNYMLNRISGFVFDFMIVSSITAIRIEDLRSLWFPFLILVFAVGFTTLGYIVFIARRVYPDYPEAATMGMFGMLTGTASTGIILLREVDPNFETPAANDLVMGSTTAIFFGFPILLLVGIAPISLTHTLIALAVIALLALIAIGTLVYFNPKKE
ncbi:MAG: sodium/glutamate symporter [Bacillota bacterium]